ncbi:hypothetical protein BBH99_16275 [Chryseobacterium contaminans]|uniref:Uncharacterized protein n=1 Tax=Chryseobacterium contaminans TaxID=1423959 RepID=A0ABX2X9Z1_9FLAO|nr:hypothetical protein [Chryseobacterium contaminans]OCA80241.1 hypothetical protein BBH99_16275 [Chryseobacterium contaminans]
MKEGECRLVMQKEYMVEAQDIMRQDTLKEYISMKNVVTTTEVVVMVMGITGKNKKSTEIFSAFCFVSL